MALIEADHKTSKRSQQRHKDKYAVASVWAHRLEQTEKFWTSGLRERDDIFETRLVDFLRPIQDN